jgi:hypothetical protein
MTSTKPEEIWSRSASAFANALLFQEGGGPECRGLPWSTSFRNRGQNGMIDNARSPAAA